MKYQCPECGYETESLPTALGWQGHLKPSNPGGIVCRKRLLDPVSDPASEKSEPAGKIKFKEFL